MSALWWSAVWGHGFAGAYFDEAGSERVLLKRYRCPECRAVNPVPRTYFRGFGALPLQGGRNIHPRAYARGVLSFDLEALDTWYGVNVSHLHTIFWAAYPQ